ncbi:acyltransferase family protein [Vitreimonas flagellata]|uniref:acyltransferase family protein n=1 Tax=Vitreimonas flagellata TaxID=2560861 RepID=UPI001074A75B|nr:acyltransferase [Vitreimonas flagellata]
MDKERFVTLDGLRGVAALAVLLGHAFKTDSAERVNEVLPFSYLAVDLFFMLSGFVIAHAYEHKLRDGMGLWTFLRVRFIRLAPLHVLGTALGLALILYGVWRGWHDYPIAGLLLSFGLSVFFIPTPPGIIPQNTLLFPLNAPAWSLFFEMAANIVFALLAPTLTTARLASIVALGAIAIAAIPLTGSDASGGPIYAGIFAGSARVVFAFFAGALLFRLHRSGATSKLRMPALPLLIILGAVLLWRPPTWLVDVYFYASVFVLFPLLIAVGAQSASRGFTSVIADMLGRSSYAVYIVQAPLLLFFNLIVIKLYGEPLGAFGWPAVLVSSALVVVIALALDRFYDGPVRAFLSKFSKRRGLFVVSGGGDGKSQHSP